MILTATINEVKRRILFDNPQAIVAVKGDYEVNGIAFAFPAIYEDDFDLSTAVKTVYYKATDGIIYNHVVTATDTDTGYPLWVFKDEINKGAYGDVEFALVCDKVEGGNIVKRWVSMITAFRVQKSIEIDESEQEENEQTYSERLADLMTQMANMQATVSGLASGAPTPESLVANMQEGRIYVYTGTETGYTAGHLYYYVNGTLTDGGQYGGTTVDTTLTVSGAAADAKKTGDEIATVKEDLFVGLNSLALGNRLLIKKLVFSDGYWGRDGNFVQSTTTFHTDKMEAVPGHKYYIEFPTTTPKITMRNFNADGTVNKSSDIITSGVFTPTTNIIAFIAIGNAKSDNIYLFDAETALASNKPYKDKTISIIGDSLSDKSNSTASTRYYDIVDQMLGTISTEYAMSGCGYKRKYNNGDAFYEQAAKIATNTDLVLIFGSFNDHNIYDADGLGELTDTTTDTVFGCVYTTLQTIFTRAPKASVGIILPTPWAQYPPYETNTLQWDYIEGIKKIASRYSIPVLDLYTESNMRPWDETFRINYYRENGVQDNGTHPNSDGHKRFAPKVVEFVKSILESNT